MAIEVVQYPFFNPERVVEEASCGGGSIMWWRKHWCVLNVSPSLNKALGEEHPKCMSNSCWEVQRCMEVL